MVQALSCHDNSQDMHLSAYLIDQMLAYIMFSLSSPLSSGVFPLCCLGVMVDKVYSVI